MSEPTRLTETEAIDAADRVLALINSSPRTPSREMVAAAIGYTRTYDTIAGSGGWPPVSTGARFP